MAAETIRGWRHACVDQGSTRSTPQPVVDLLCQLKDDDRTLSIPGSDQARAQHRKVVSDEVVLAESTVHRLLTKRG